MKRGSTRRRTAAPWALLLAIVAIAGCARPSLQARWDIPWVGTCSFATSDQPTGSPMPAWPGGAVPVYETTVWHHCPDPLNAPPALIPMPASPPVPSGPMAAPVVQMPRPAMAAPPTAYPLPSDYATPFVIPSSPYALDSYSRRSVAAQPYRRW